MPRSENNLAASKSVSYETLILSLFVILLYNSQLSS